MFLFSKNVIDELIKVRIEGAQKHGAVWGYRKKNQMYFIDKIRRHLLAHLKGETIDSETGFSHLAKVACNAILLLDVFLRGNK